MFARKLMGVAVLFCGIAMTGCHRGQVELPPGPGTTRTTWRDIVKVEIFHAEVDRLHVLIDPPVGYAAARQQPTDEFRLDSRLQWNRLVDRLAALYTELVERHNGAKITARAYDARLITLDATRETMERRLANLEETLRDCTAVRRKLHALRWSTNPTEVKERGDLTIREKQFRERTAEILTKVAKALDDLTPAGTPDGADAPKD